jgi:hypothetical protein
MSSDSPQNVNPFEDRLTTLVSAEIAHAVEIFDHSRAAAAIEAQARALALSIAVATRGHTPTMSDFLDGVSQHLFEETARYARIGKAVGSTDYPQDTHNS